MQIAPFSLLSVPPEPSPARPASIPAPPAAQVVAVPALMAAAGTNKKRRGDVFYPFFVLFIINNV